MKAGHFAGRVALEDGAAARQTTKESFRLLSSPVWHPNGNYLAGRKHFTTRRSLGTGEIWQFWPATGVNYTPTLIVTFGGLGAENYFYQDSEVWTHPILSRFVPPHILQPRSVRRPMAPLTDYQPIRDSAANAKRLFEKGVMVNIGAHGQREGLGSHWEMWAFVLGGMTPMQALHTATINPARHMGFAKDLGSLETGKLADMLIIDGNPLQDIRVTDKIAFVVQNGRIYEGGTLAEKVTGERKVAPFYWQR